MAHRLSMPKCGGGHLQFNDLVRSFGGPDEVARNFHIAPELVQRWMAGIVDVPRTVMVALWWHSHFGFDQAYREAHWTHEFMSFLHNQARQRVELLERLIVQAGYIVPAGGLMSHKQMAEIPAEGWQAHVTTVERPALVLQPEYEQLAGRAPALTSDAFLASWELSA